MFTLSLKSEMTNVTGVMIPCHSPSQNPASSWPPVAATSFAPGAHAARASPPTATPSATRAGLDRFLSPPSSFARGQTPPRAGAGLPSYSRARVTLPLDLPLDLPLAERRPVDVPGVEHQAD